jgi:alkylation response protein AidB-like acyl-CoA dehydrogenase
MLVTAAHLRERERYRAFAEQEILPHAARFDREQRVPPEIIRRLAEAGFLGALAPRAAGGAELDATLFGLLNRELGRCCSSVRSLLTAHSMVLHALVRWGSAQQRERWLGALARGEVLAAFALSEPDVGSDARAVRAEAVPTTGGYRLRGVKQWVTGGQLAGLFLVLVQVSGKPTAFLVERESAGIAVAPIADVLGARASMLARLELDGCDVPAGNRMGGEGLGFSMIASSALDCGRFSVAWGCLGAADACLEAALAYARSRRQFGRPIAEHQLVARLLSDMITEVHASEALCLEAAALREANDARSMHLTMMAKYFVSRVFARAARSSVQIHGANGCSAQYPVERYYRDAKVMEIIEGSNEIQQIAIAAGYVTSSEAAR